MNRDKAATLEGMMLAARALLQGIADYTPEAAADPQRHTVMLKIGTAMSELIDVSRMIYGEHPDLNPYAEEDALAASLRNATPRSES